LATTLQHQFPSIARADELLNSLRRDHPSLCSELDREVDEMSRRFKPELEEELHAAVHVLFVRCFKPSSSTSSTSSSSSSSSSTSTTAAAASTPAASAAASTPPASSSSSSSTSGTNIPVDEVISPSLSATLERVYRKFFGAEVLQQQQQLL
jgi:hypothetical protein